MKFSCGGDTLTVNLYLLYCSNHDIKSHITFYPFPPHSTKESSASFKHISVQSFTFWFLSLPQLVCHIIITPKTHSFCVLWQLFSICWWFFFFSCITFDLSGSSYNHTINCKVAQKLMGVAIQLLGNQLVITTT